MPDTGTPDPIQAHAGAVLFVGIDEDEPGPALAAFLQDVRPGGVILFSRNVHDAAQTGRLTRWLQGDGPFPRLVGVDQEGGRVERLRPLLGPLPAAAAVAREGPAAAREFSAALGRALRALGFNLNFAPVLDLSAPGAPNGIGDRAFGDDPAAVARLGCAYLEGMGAAGVLGVVKHFPGLGPTTVDSHETLPRARKSEDAFRREDLVPFRAAAPLAPAAMVGHVHYPFLDARPVPASCSRSAILGLLRRELAYGGLVIADDLEMGAVEQGEGWLGAAVAAVEAGCDMLLVCHRRDRMLALRDELVRRVCEGSLSPVRLAAAAGRVETLRRRARPPGPPERFAELRDDLRRRFGAPR